MSEVWRNATDMQFIKEVVFTNHAPDDIPLPSKKYLTLHAACCKVASMSGAAEFLDGVDRDFEETDALASDGRSAHVLSAAIWRAATSHEEMRRNVQVSA